jgi:DNA (cytosine-5)-methyltransferase 1
MNRPVLLDLFCGAGGAGMGYHQAGFDLIGVDIEPQPRYPFEFHQADALSILRTMVDYPNFSGELWRPTSYAAIHASPPCQAYSAMSGCRLGLAAEYPQLVDATRALLIETGLPWVMENVAGSGLAAQDDLFGTKGLMLCGAMFGAELYRHRMFESSLSLAAPNHPRHLISASPAGHWRPGSVISVAGNCSPISLARKAMGIDWMNRDELAEAIPPAFTRFIGEQLIEQLSLARAS